MNRRFPIQVVFILAFFIGLFKIVGVSPVIVKYTIEGLIFLIFLSAFGNSKKRGIPLLKEFIVFSLAVLFAVLYSGDYHFGALTFYRKTLIPYLLFISVYLKNLSIRDTYIINKTIFVLFIIQIIAAFPKLVFIGLAEKYVGTISHSGGSMNNSLPIMALLFLWSLYLFNKSKISKRKLFFLVCGYVFFAIVGVKRAFWVFLPALYFIGTFFYNKYVIGMPFVMPKLLPKALMGILFVLVGITLNPYLNPTREFGGEINLEYTRDYTIAYNLYDEESGEYQGRLGGNYKLISDLLTESNYILKRERKYSWLFGFGPSSFYGDNYLIENEDVDIETKAFIPTGFFRMMFSCGLFGVLAFLLFYKRIIIGQFKRIKKNVIGNFNKFGRAVVFSVFMYSIFIILEFLFYSDTYGTYLIFPYFYFLALIYKKHPIIMKNE